MIGGNPIASREKKEQEMMERRNTSLSGRGLHFHVKVPAAHTWLREPTRLLTGRDFIRAIHLRFDLMPTRIILNRLDIWLDAKCPCCLTQEHSLAHCLQVCPRTSGFRIKRHDVVVKYLYNKIKVRNLTANWAPHFRTEEGLLKPNIVCVLNDTIMVIDISIVSDNIDLDYAYKEKVNKYSRRLFLNKVKQHYRKDSVKVGAMIINWRGAIAPASLTFHNWILKNSDLKLLSVRTLSYGVYIWDA